MTSITETHIAYPVGAIGTLKFKGSISEVGGGGEWEIKTVPVQIDLRTSFASEFSQHHRILGVTWSPMSSLEHLASFKRLSVQGDANGIITVCMELNAGFSIGGNLPEIEILVTYTIQPVTG